MTSIQSTLSQALTGGPRPTQRWRVVGADHRRRQVDVSGYRSRADATDFAAELRGKGGTVRVVRDGIR